MSATGFVMGYTGAYAPLPQGTGAGAPGTVKVLPAIGYAVLEELILGNGLKIVLKARARYSAVSSLQFTPTAMAFLDDSREGPGQGQREIASMSVSEMLGLPSASAAMWQNVVLYLETKLGISVREDRDKIKDACAAAGRTAMKFVAVLMADVAMGVLTDEEMAEAKNSAVVLKVMET